MKWLTSFVTILIFTQVASAEYAMVQPSLGNVQLMVGANGAAPQNMTAAQLQWLASLDPRNANLMQFMDMSAFFGGRQSPVYMNSLSSLSGSTRVSVSARERDASKVGALADSYNSGLRKKEQSGQIDSGAEAKSKLEAKYAEGLKSCQAEVRKYSSLMFNEEATKMLPIQKESDRSKAILKAGDTVGNWMFLRRRTELVSESCKAALLASSGNDRYSPTQVENRQGQIKGERNFTLQTYGGTSPARQKKVAR